MTELLYALVSFAARIHDKIMLVNDYGGYGYSDKTLHFLVMGAVGMGILLIIYPLFKLLSKNHVLVIAFIYVITVMVVLTFAIEIGQGYTGTGAMEMEDVVAGLAGFLYMFAIFAVARAVILGIYHAITGRNRKRDRDKRQY